MGKVNWIPNPPAAWADMNALLELGSVQPTLLYMAALKFNKNKPRVRLEVKNKIVKALEKISFHFGVQIYQTRTPES